MDKVTCVKHFLAVIKYGGFNAASRHLYISPSNISRQVSYLEDQLNGKLIERSTKQISLTPLGHAFIGKAENLLTCLEQTFDLEHYELIPRYGTLILSVAPVLGNQFILPKVLSFSKKNPGIDFSINGLSHQTDILSSSIDLSFSHLNIKEGSLAKVPILRSQFIFVASKHYLDQYGTPKHPKDLSQHNCILWSSDANPRLWRLNNKKIKVYGNIATDNGYLMRNLLLSHKGIAQTARFLVKDDIDNNTLIPILKAYTRDVPFYAYYQKDSKNRQLIEEFCNHIQI